MFFQLVLTLTIHLSTRVNLGIPFNAIITSFHCYSKNVTFFPQHFDLNLKKFLSERAKCVTCYKSSYLYDSYFVVVLLYGLIETFNHFLKFIRVLVDFRCFRQVSKQGVFLLCYWTVQLVTFLNQSQMINMCMAPRNWQKVSNNIHVQQKYD